MKARVATAALAACALLALSWGAAPRADTAGGADRARIVAVGGDVTEILYALGADALIVATDTTSLYPSAALQTPKVGYLRSLAAEGILSLEPTLVIAAGGAGPPETLAQLRDAGVGCCRSPRRTRSTTSTRRWSRSRPPPARRPRRARSSPTSSGA
jgi:iron complex transport system substrate-binding protein